MRFPLTLILIAAALLGCAPFESRFLRPPRTMWQPPERAEVLDIPAPQSGTIRAWLFHPESEHPAPIPLLILSHGRSDSMADYRTLAPQLADAISCAVLVYDYRGFGASSDLDNPTRQTLIDDASAVLATIAQRPDIDPDNVMLMGVSLGAYPAAATFADTPDIQALVLWGAPADIRMLINDGHTELNPITQLAAKLLIRRHREPESSLRHAAQRPILIAHAEQDTIIRVEHAHRLKLAAPHATLIIDEEGTHTSISEPVLEEIIAFLRANSGP